MSAAPKSLSTLLKKSVSGLSELMPRMGAAGSRSSTLHVDSRPDRLPSTMQLHLLPQHVAWDASSKQRLRAALFLGTMGSIILAIGGLGAGAFPVIGNPYWEVPLVGILARMLHATTVMCFVGIGLMVIAWLLLARFALPRQDRVLLYLPQRVLWRVFACWVTPLMFTAPLFTQDIYSYLAQGAITAQGLDPYSGGPVDILGVQDNLARSVPLMWAHSPAPYGPVALGYGGIISWLTGDSILWSILAHRIVAIVGLAMSAWALIRLARRCGVAPQVALWIGVLNPLAILHLVGGVHNESAMMGLLLVGFELVLWGVHNQRTPTREWVCILAGLSLISMAGLVKVTAFMGLGFAGIAIARWLGGKIQHVVAAAFMSLIVGMAVSVFFSLITNTGFGWITSQGGAAEIVSWMSLTTLLGLSSNVLALWLGLGDHLSASLLVFRAMGIVIAGLWLLRMLWATYRGRIHPLGGMGIATFVLIIFFPVVQPWYLLWALMPLAAWVNRRAFLQVTVIYSVAFSFAILPRGLGLPPLTVIYIYAMSIAAILALLACAHVASRHNARVRAILDSSGLQELSRARFRRKNLGGSTPSVAGITKGKVQAKGSDN